MKLHEYQYEFKDLIYATDFIREVYNLLQS